MLDLNGFKAVNDRDGHEAGDRLLKASAAAWSAELRETDLLARLGGDEFAVLLADCGEADAPALAVRLRRAPRAAAGLRRRRRRVGRRRGRHRAAAAGRQGAVRRQGPRRAGQARRPGPAAGARRDPPGGGRAGRRARRPHAHGGVRARRAGGARDPGRTTSASGSPASTASSGWAADDRGTPIAYSFCRHVVATGRPLVVKDARADPLVADNPAVDELDVLAYAGIPLVDDGGQPIGALCAIDDRPRDWRDDEVLLLHRLAERAIAELGS